MLAMAIVIVHVIIRAIIISSLKIKTTLRWIHAKDFHMDQCEILSVRTWSVTTMIYSKPFRSKHC